MTDDARTTDPAAPTGSPDHGGTATLRVSCLGDSITRGQLGADVLALLRRRHAPGRLRLRRFAANGDLAWNLRQRLDEVIATPADVITVLIGTNDARAAVPGHPVDRVVRRKGLPTRPSPAWFEDNLAAVVERLRAETDARVALLTLPVLGQDLDGPAAEASASYSRTVAGVAAAHGVACLPLHDRQVDELRRLGAPPVPYEEATPARIIGDLLRQAVLRRSVDDIARRRGLALTVDHVHQNSRGAGLIAEVIDAHLATPAP